MRRILITGAHGFIGRHLSKRLARQGDFVDGLGHGIWSAKDALEYGVHRWSNGDINIENLRMLQQQATPEVVYHLAGGSKVSAAITNPHEDFFRTVVSTAELLEWLRLYAPSTQLIVVSSAAVYGTGHIGQIPENASLSPFSPYGYHKQLMESLCRSYADSYGLKVTVTRLFSVFGPGLTKQLLWDICTRLAAGESPLVLGGSGNELRDWTDVREVVRALALMSTLSVPMASGLNIGTGEATSVRQIANELFAAWYGHESAGNVITFSNHSRKGDPFSLVADPQQLNRLGFQWMLSRSQGLEDYVAWFKKFTRISK